MSYRDPGGKAPEQPPEPQPKFYIVWPFEAHNSSGRGTVAALTHESFDTWEELHTFMETKAKAGRPLHGALMFYGYMAIPKVQVEIQTIKNVKMTFEAR